MQKDGIHAEAGMRLVVLFGGQGSQGLISSHLAEGTDAATVLSSSAAILLSKCHAAFLEELLELNAGGGPYPGLDASHFRTAKDLVSPRAQYHTHGILQSSLICLHQLLHYIAAVERNSTLESAYSQLIETAGLCSGMVPAIVVAAAANEEQFMRFGVGAFRLAFWVGWRATIEAQKVATASDKDHAWSLVVSGLSRTQVEKHMEEYYSTSSRPLARISVVAGSNISISGPPQELALVKTQMNSSITTLAWVHAWYHGGPELERAVLDVAQDVQRRAIVFPTAADMRKPVRSTLDGCFLPETVKDWIPCVVRHLLVHCVDWGKTSHEICTGLAQYRDEEQPVQILSMGPSTSSLLAEIKAAAPQNVRLVDLSPFSPKASEPLSRPDDIAIVGMGVNLPGSPNLDQLWETLSTGRCTTQEIPASRFKLSDYYSADGAAKGRTMPIKYGSFLDDVWNFDNAFFNVSPREATTMDPQQRILLHTTQAALDDAGYVRDATPSFQRETIGCWVGVATGDYPDNLRDSIDVYYSPGTLRAFHSGRIAYVYKTSGPTITTDTACSSSMVSIYQACQAIRNGECTSAIAGGVNVISSPDMYLGLAHGHFLSPTGGCKPFDESADGYCRAEGCAIFILKRLSDAVAENDRIHGVIKGAAVNQSGNSHSITHPHSETQAKLFETLLRRTQIDPASINVVEAHGTGTQAGDAREVASLDEIFGKYHSKSNPLIISSIKGAVGHCEAASGAASLAKLLLMLKKKELVPQAGHTTLNPRLTALKDGRLAVSRERARWKQSQPYAPRRALLNNFGAAGSNAALILEEFRPHRPGNAERRSAFLFSLSAKSRNALEMMVRSYEGALSSTKHSLLDLCYTATARREIWDYRVSFPCRSVEDLQRQLSRVDIAKISPTPTKKNMVFVFSGQGYMHVGMGQELMSSLLFRNLINQCDRIVCGLGFGSIVHFLTSQKDDYGVSPDSTDYLIISQCAGVALEYSLAKLLMSFGARPDYLIGHSLGEYAALAVSGAITLEDTLRVVAMRAKLMTEHCETKASGMLACRLPPFKTDALIAKHELKLTVACRNSSDDCVVAGSLDQLAALEETCAGQKVKCRRLEVPYGFHSAAMRPIIKPLKELCDSIAWAPPQIPVASNVFGRFFEEGDLGGEYFARHATEPVRFNDAVSEMRSQGIFTDTVCWEVGPYPSTLPMLQSAISPTECACIPTLHPDKSAWHALTAALGQIFVQWDEIKWRDVFPSHAAMIDLPSYPLQGARYHVPYSETAENTTAGESRYQGTGFDLLPMLVSQDDEQARFETSTATIGPLIAGHSVGGTAICPASVFCELAMEGAQALYNLNDGQFFALKGMNFASPLIYDSSHDAQPVHVLLRPHGSSLSFKIVTPSLNGDESVCCSGTLEVRDAVEIKPRWLMDAAIMQRQRNHLLAGEEDLLSKFQTRVLYENVFTRVVRYSEDYQTLDYLSLAGLEGIGKFRMPETTTTGGRLCPPAFADTLLHAAGFIANLSVKGTEICICGHVESVEILYHEIDYQQTFTVYCSLFDIVKGTIVADAWAMNPSGEIVAIVRGMHFKKLQLASFQRMLGNANPKNERHPSKGGDSQEEKHEDTQEYTQPSKSDESKTFRGVLTRLVSQVGGFEEDSLDFNNTLEAMGIDSLLAIELSSKLKDEFPEYNVDHHELAGCETLLDMEQTLASMMGPSKEELSGDDTTPVRTPPSDTHAGTESPSSSASDVPRNPTALHVARTDATPLCLFHDGSGTVKMYAKLQDFDRTTYAFHDPHFVDSAAPFTSLNEMANTYAKNLSSLALRSVVLAGWSFGGIVAFAVAQRLAQLGLEVKGIVLIDSPYPVNHQPLPTEVVSYVTKSTSADSGLAQEFRRNASLLGEYEPPSAAEKVPVVMLHSQETFDTKTLCGVQYDWLSSQDARSEALKQWESLVGVKMEVLPIHGNHFEPFTAKNIKSTSAQLWSACQRLDRD